MSDIIGYINFNNGEIPEIFNPSNFLSSSITTNSLTSSNIDTTNLNINSLAIYNGTSIPNTNTIATTQYVDQKLSSLIDGSPDVLNTLSEIANSINNDPAIYDTITTNLSLKSNVNNPSLTGILLLNNVDISGVITTNSNNISELQNKTTNIDNTSDINKPISTATQNAINLKSNIDNPTFTTQITTPSIILNNIDLNTRISTSENKITTLEGKTNAISYNGLTNTTTINSKLTINLDEINNGNLTIGDTSTDKLIVNSATTFNSSVLGLTKSMVGLSNVDNTSDINKPISTATQNAINLKANIDNPSFTTRITAPQITLNGSDLLTRLNNNETVLTNIQSKTAGITYNSSNQTTTISKLTISQNELSQGTVTIGDQSTDTLTINSATQFNGNVSGLTKSTVGLSNVDNTSDLLKPISTATQNAINLKADDNNVVHLVGSETIGGLKTFSIVPKVNNVNIATMNDISSLVNSAPSTLDTLNELASALGNDPNFATSISTQIGLKAPIDNPTFTGTVNGISKSMVGLSNVDNTTDLLKPISTATQIALDLKSPIDNPTFTTAINTPVINLNGTNLSTTLSTFLTSSTASSTYQTIANMTNYVLTTTLSNYVLNSVLTTTLNNYLTTTTASSTYQTIANMTNYLTTSTASSTYQTIANMTNYLTTNTSQTITAQKIFNAPSQFSKLYETITAGTITTNAMSLDFSTINGIISCSPSSATNFSLSLSNIPVISNNYSSYSISLLINTSTNKNYCNAITINGTSYTMIAVNGLTSVSVNASSVYALQTITILFINSSTPTKVLTSVCSLY